MNLPYEILLNIVDYLNVQDTLRFAMTNKSCLKILDDRHYWRNRADRAPSIVKVKNKYILQDHSQKFYDDVLYDCDSPMKHYIASKIGFCPYVYRRGKFRGQQCNAITLNRIYCDICTNRVATQASLIG